MMKSLLATYFSQRDEWLYFALVFSFSLYQLENPLWSKYIGHILNNAVYLSPLIIFKLFENTIVNRISRNYFRVLKISIFVVYPVAFVYWEYFFSSLVSVKENHFIDRTSMILLFALGVEVLLFINQFLSNKRLIKWAPKNIGLSDLVLLFMSFISVYTAMLITSDLPLWLESNSIQNTINFIEIANQPLMAISLAFQIFCLFFCGYIFYWINLHVLVKSVLAKRGWIIYFCSVISVVVTLYPIIIELYLFLPINTMAEPIIPAVNADPFDWNNGRVFMAVLLLSLPVILVTQWHNKSSQFALLEKESIKTELQLLKQQIDPHFFFNTLNNLYALCRKKSDLAPEIVLQLSELMQYVVYKGQEPWVCIEEEVRYINDYINLQSIRFSNKISIKCEVDIGNEQALVSPLLLIILVENAFKHGVELATKECYLHIHLSVKNHQLRFVCKNSFEHESPIKFSGLSNKRIKHKKVKLGVGLPNLRRRLMLIYPKAHQLELVKQGNEFKAILDINLEETFNKELNGNMRCGKID
ncbi:MAG: sensor histidine kinase [Colwelliaceae bacterium]|nr:sensor histidine kinase [Colwelliaceae bacterium]